MSIRFTYECGGCDATATVTAPSREFHGITGRPNGFGYYTYPTPNDCAPEGWTAYDIIGCTYCPTCSAELFGTESK